MSKIKYDQIVKLDQQDLWKNSKKASCIICYDELKSGTGYSLRCGIDICKDCLVSHIVSSSVIPIVSPAYTTQLLEEREIRQALSKQQLTSYLKQCQRELVLCDNRGSKIVSCKSGDCGFICCLTPSTTDVNINKPLLNFTCPRCQLVMCLRCNESHSSSITCMKYAESISHTKRGKQLLDIETRIKNKKLMRCVNCFNLISKPTGCNWVRCNMCRLELCWVLQIRRWGPKGRGDISGGCKCFVENKTCSVDCHSSCSPHND